MANIFALRGAGSSGKSSTLIDLLNQITSKYPSAIVQNFHESAQDVKVIISPIQGLRIGIESQGDPNSRLEKSLADFRTANCDIVFCACRTRGMTVMWINAMSPPDNVQFIQQTYSRHDHQAVNSAVATNLMKMAGI